MATLSKTKINNVWVSMVKLLVVDPQVIVGFSSNNTKVTIEICKTVFVHSFKSLCLDIY